MQINFNKLSQLLILYIQFDSGIYRYASAKTALEYYFVPTAIGYITRVGTIAGLIIFTALSIKRRRVSHKMFKKYKVNELLCTKILICNVYYLLLFPQDKKEHLYRTGQIPYESRERTHRFC